MIFGIRLPVAPREWLSAFERAGRRACPGKAAALDELEELDVEHERRRSTAKHNAGEAA